MTQTFSYDGFGRLGSEAHDSATATYGPGSESYTYDAAGNRNQAGYSYTTTNAVRGRPAIGGDGFAPGDSLAYDAAGNPTWWKNRTAAGYDSLTWDAEDRLVRLRRYSSGGSLQLDANYAYDGFGRRVKKWGTGVTTTSYVWNGWELLAETDGSGTATRRYTHAPEGLDFPLAMRQGSTTSLFHLDGQGNVYLLTNTSGTRRSEYRYRAYGDRYVTPVGEAVQSPFGYKAREEDRETGLVYMRNRYYSPRLERFLNQDPIGIAGGLNVYAFAGLNPVNFADPMGLIGPCSKVITRINGEVVHEEYNWQGCEWFLDLLRAMTNTQVWAWMGGPGLGMPGGLSPFDGGHAGTSTVGGTGDQGSGEDDDSDDRECARAVVGAVPLVALDFGSAALGIKATWGVIRGGFSGVRMTITASKAFWNHAVSGELGQFTFAFAGGILPSGWDEIAGSFIPGISGFLAIRDAWKACEN